MLARRIRRDVKERGRDVEGILDQVGLCSTPLTLTRFVSDLEADYQYLRFVKSNYDNFVQPSSKFADIVSSLDHCQCAADCQIVPGSSNHLAIDLLVTHIKGQLDSRSLRFRNMLARLADDDAASPISPKNAEEGVILLEQTPQLTVGHPETTLIRRV